jgi:Peptidase S46
MPLVTRLRLSLLAVLIFLACAVFPALADEGLWLWNQFPTEAVKQKHDFDVTPAFLDELRLASVRIGGESGSFVSSSGLILTTRQVANGCLTSAGRPGYDLLQDGFLAADAASEIRCAGLDAEVLVSLEDVTAQVTPQTKGAGQALAQRNAAIVRIEKDCAAKTGNVCSVVRLFAGGRYDLYQYKRYSDVRLDFAPEYPVAFFGKERDAITYLRYGLNVAFLRAYENGRPAATPHYLKWSGEGVKDGDLVLASGNPGATSRSVTAAQLTFYRDTALPVSVTRAQSRIQALNTFSAASEENQRAAQPVLTPLLNGFKTDAGKLIGLRDDRLVTRKTTFEQKIRRAVEADSKLGADPAKVWDDVASAYKKWAPFEKSYQILESPAAPGSKLFAIARQIVRHEPVDPSNVNTAIETLMLTQYLEELRSLGEKDKDVPLKAIFAGKTPRQAAEAMVEATKLKDPSARVMSGVVSDDPLIHLATLLDPQALRLRKQREEIVGALEVSAAEKIAQYRLKLFGAADYPDGTSTPRVSFGVVSGYTDRAAVPQPFAATFSGLYYRVNNNGPWQVPQNWVEKRLQLNPVTPLDFVSTCDTGGGAFGGPVVNRAGELVGVTFDGNLESLPNVYLYIGDQARAVHVDVRGIAEALAKVYDAGALLKELGVRTGAGAS